MYPNGTYHQSDCETNEIDNICVWAISGNCRAEVKPNVDLEKDKEYSYDEAIEIAGTGWYTIGLLATLSLSLLAMSIDMFSFSTIVALSSCDFFLTHTQTHILLSMPFLGPIIMAYAWGYVSDTQGRRWSLLIAMPVSFIMSVCCAFAPNWIALAIFKLIGTCFCSCTQSVGYALLGESCSQERKGTYLFIMSSIAHIAMGVYFATAYAIGFLEFAYDLGFIIFVPWRLLVLILAMPLGLSGFALFFFYESPKFLLNTGKKDQALNVLSSMCRRNRGIAYPVKNVALYEAGNVANKSSSFWTSLWYQTIPLFKPPLLSKTVLLYCLIFIIYSSSSSLFIWLPFLASDFTNAVKETTELHQGSGICFIVQHGEKNKDTADEVECTPRIHLPIVIFTVSVGVTFSVLNFLMSKVADKKKILMTIIFVFSSGCCLGTLHIPNNMTNIILYFGILSDGLCMGIVFTYFVDFYPTSFRGMAACLGVMVARLSSIFGVNLIGAYITWHCHTAFYALAGLIFSGAILTCLIPTESVKKL